MLDATLQNGKKQSVLLTATKQATTATRYCAQEAIDEAENRCE